MKFTITQFGTFASQWKAARLTDSDLRALELQLMAEPQAGDVMRGTGGIRKVRFAPRSRNIGKSGAFRVCYVCIIRHEVIALVAMFGKNDQANLTSAERNALARRVAEYERSFER